MKIAMLGYTPFSDKPMRFDGSIQIIASTVVLAGKAPPSYE